MLLHVAAAYQVFSMNVYTAIEEQLTDVSGYWGIPSSGRQPEWIAGLFMPSLDSRGHPGRAS